MDAEWLRDKLKQIQARPDPYCLSRLTCSQPFSGAHLEDGTRARLTCGGEEAWRETVLASSSAGTLAGGATVMTTTVSR
jgi:hypothetical protein